MKEIHIKTMLGMGDNLFSRPIIKQFLREYDRVHLHTPWPQAYHDFYVEYFNKIRFHPVNTKLRTQNENVNELQRTNRYYSETLIISNEDNLPPRYYKLINGKPQGFRLAYNPQDIKKGMNHHDSLLKSSAGFINTSLVNPRDIEFDIPLQWIQSAQCILSDSLVNLTKPPIIIRPPTVRTEWKNPARNPYIPAYLDMLEDLRKDYTLISVANLQAGKEWLDVAYHSNLVDIEFHHGELKFEDLISLTHLYMTAGANGFLLPMSLAARGKTFILFGGNYGYNAPHNLLHPGYDLSRISYIEPDKPCYGCVNPNHDCNKFISSVRLTDALEKWLNSDNKVEKEMGKKLTSKSFDYKYYEEHKNAGLDYLNYGGWQYRYANWLTDVFDWQAKSVLDIGCACGSICEGFRNNRVHIYGIDVNESMIQMGREHFKNPRLYTCDVVNMHLFEDNKFDGLHSAQVFEHFNFELLPHIIVECYRVLKMGGLFFLCLDTVELYERQGRKLEDEDPTHTCVLTKDQWLREFGDYFEDITGEYMDKLKNHPQSMLQGSSSTSPVKYDWDFFVLRKV